MGTRDRGIPRSSRDSQPGKQEKNNDPVVKGWKTKMDAKGALTSTGIWWELMLLHRYACEHTHALMYAHTVSTHTYTHTLMYAQCLHTVSTQASGGNSCSCTGTHARARTSMLSVYASTHAHTCTHVCSHSGYASTCTHSCMLTQCLSTSHHPKEPRLPRRTVTAEDLI